MSKLKTSEHSGNSTSRARRFVWPDTVEHGMGDYEVRESSTQVSVGICCLPPSRQSWPVFSSGPAMWRVIGDQNHSVQSSWSVSSVGNSTSSPSYRGPTSFENRHMVVPLLMAQFLGPLTATPVSLESLIGAKTGSVAPVALLVNPPIYVCARPVDLTST